jgi:cell division septum initiation protein DivIVA
MQRDQILRNDFPRKFRGWDPSAVRAHLRSVVESMPDANQTLASDVAEHVGHVIEAAERVARQIEIDSRLGVQEETASTRAEAELALAEARSEAQDAIAAARAEADRTLAAAQEEARRATLQAQAEAHAIVERGRADARERVELARSAVEGLAEEVTRVLDQIGALGDRIAASLEGEGGRQTVIEPAYPVVAVPAATAAKPANGNGHAGANGNGHPEAAQPAAAPVASIADAAGSASRADRIRSRFSREPGEGLAATSDVVAARLLAMKMAVDGASREEISDRIDTEFGPSRMHSELLDDVLARTAHA